MSANHSKEQEQKQAIEFDVSNQSIAECRPCDSLKDEQTSAQPNDPIFPDELWLVVFAFLTVEDVVRIRVTCTRFLSLTKERTLWMKLVARMRADHQLPPTSPLLLPQTVEAFERQAIRYLQYRRNLIRGTAKFSPVKFQEHTSHFSGHLFVPGGRWLLTAAEHNILCWDLSSEDQRPESICNSAPDETWGTQQMATELLEDGTGATLGMMRIDRETYDFFSVLFTEEKPQVTHRGSFKPQQSFSSLITSGSFALGVSASFWEQPKVVLFEWEKLLSEAPFQCGHAMFPEGSSRIVGVQSLLPDGRIIAYSCNTIMVYTPPPLQELTTIEPPLGYPFKLEPVWSFSPSESLIHAHPIDSSHLGNPLQHLGHYALHSYRDRIVQLFADGKGFKVAELKVPFPQSSWKAGYLSGLLMDTTSDYAKWNLHMFARPSAAPSKGCLTDKTVSFSCIEVENDLQWGERCGYHGCDYDELSGRLIVIINVAGPDVTENVIRIGYVDLQ